MLVIQYDEDVLARGGGPHIHPLNRMKTYFHMHLTYLFLSFVLSDTVLPTLLVLLQHPLAIIRQAAMGCVQALNDTEAIAVDDGLKYLINALISSDTEIVQDPLQIACVFKKLFVPLCNTSSEVEMLDAQHLEDLRFITKYLADFILRSEKKHLSLGIAAVTGLVKFQGFFVHLLPLLKDLLASSQTAGLSPSDFLLLRILIQKFESSTVDIFLKFPSSLKLFKTALTLGKVCPGSNLMLQELVLKQVDASFYSSIASAKPQSEIFDTLLSSAVTTSSTDVAKAIRLTLLELPLNSEDVARQISSFGNQDEEDNPKKAKRMRRYFFIL